MSREDYVAIAARLAALYVALQVLLQAPGVFQAVSQGGSAALVSMFALFFLVGIGLCVFLWFFPLTVARRLLPVMREARSEQAIDASVGLSLGLTLIGLWLLANGLIDAIYWGTMLVLSRQYASVDVPVEWTPEQISGMAATAFEVCAGAWLLLGSTGLKRVIEKFRYGRQAEVSSSNGR